MSPRPIGQASPFAGRVPTLGMLNERSNAKIGAKPACVMRVDEQSSRRLLQVLTIIRPETLVRWHRAGFRCYWRWTSRPLGGRPQIDSELRVLNPADERRKSALGRCVKKTRERHAVRKMKEDPSEPSCRGRLQTAISCFGQKPRWCCVKKVRKRHAVREMKEDPSEPLCRRRLQTAMSCFSQKLRW